jgi:predicted PurR-regulated permease PerM
MNDKLKDLDTKKVNDVLGLAKNILKVVYVLLLIVSVYIITILIKEWNIITFLVTLLKIAAPLFIGLAVAWLFDPFVTYLKTKGIKRVWGSAITYVILLASLAIIIGTIIPLMSSQINELVKNLPTVFNSIEKWIDGFFVSLSNIENFNATSMKEEIFLKLEEFGVGLTNDLPTLTVNFLKSFLSGLGVIVIGLIIGFYILISFGNVKIVDLLPMNLRKDTKKLMISIDDSLRRFVKGAFFDATLVFIVTSILLWAVGLKAPLLFGLFCGLTNVIPFAGPYIGGTPAVIFGFSQNPTVGLLTLLVIVIVQFIEGNFFQPVIMSKSTKLHPVTIISGLLIFGYFFGIVGMFISTPTIAVFKSIFKFFDDKYDLLNFYN